MDVGAVMQALADRLDTIDDLNCFGYPIGAPPVPAAVVAYPDDITYDQAYKKALVIMTVPVVAVIGRPNDLSTRDRLTKYAAGSGADSFKAVLESGTYAGVSTVRLQSAEFDVIQFGTVDYMCGIFYVKVWGSGA